jgi:hypothetical protein
MNYLLLDGGRTMLESLLKDIYCVNDVLAGAPYSLNNFIEQVNCERIGIGSKIKKIIRLNSNIFLPRHLDCKSMAYVEWVRLLLMSLAQF